MYRLFHSAFLFFSNLLPGGGGGLRSGGGGNIGGGGGGDGPPIAMIIGGLGLGIFVLARGCESCHPTKSLTGSLVYQEKHVIAAKTQQSSNLPSNTLILNTAANKSIVASRAGR